MDAIWEVFYFLFFLIYRLIKKKKTTNRSGATTGQKEAHHFENIFACLKILNMHQIHASCLMPPQGYSQQPINHSKSRNSPSTCRADQVGKVRGDRIGTYENNWMESKG